MKALNIKRVGKKKVYDISVEDAEHYILEDGTVTHNTGLLYSCNQAFIITKAQEKSVTEGLLGWHFSINVEKSRFVKEKSKLIFTVLYESGIQKYSGLLDLAVESQILTKSSSMSYSFVNEDGEVLSEKYTIKKMDEVFWKKIIEDNRFKDFVKSKFKLTNEYNNSSYEPIVD